MYAADISTTTCRIVYVLEKSKTSSYINRMKYIFYIGNNDVLTLIGGHNFGVINNRPVITENSISNKN